MFLYLSHRSSPALHLLPTHGILISVPQYLPVPNGHFRAIQRARDSIPPRRDPGLVRGRRLTCRIVDANPGNPTRVCLEEVTQEEIGKLCEENSIVLLTDEVYPDNLQ